MIFDNLVSSTTLPSIICFSLALIIIFYILYSKIYPSKVSMLNGLPSRKFRILLFLFSIIVSNAYFSLYRPLIPIIPEISLYGNIIESIIVGGLLYILLFYILKFIMNNDVIHLNKINKEIKFNPKSGYVFFIILILLLSTVFSSQSAIDLSNQDHSININTSGLENFAFSKNFTKLAYTINTRQGTQLVVKDLQDTSNTKIYSLCMENKTCIKFYNYQISNHSFISYYIIQKIIYYNSSTLFIYALNEINYFNETRFIFNLQTGYITSIKDNYPSSFHQSGATFFYEINASIYLTSYSYNMTNKSAYLILINDLTSNQIIIQLPNDTSTLSNGITISPDFSKLAVSGDNYIYFYTLSKGKNEFTATFIDKEVTNSIYYVDGFRFTSWKENSSTIYYSYYMSINDYTYFSLFNFTNHQGESIGGLNGNNLVNYVNITNSYFITNDLSNGTNQVQIYSYKNNNLKFLENSPNLYFEPFDYKNNFLAISGSNTPYEQFYLVSYDSTNNNLKIDQTLDIGSYQIINLLYTIRGFLEILTLVSAFALLLMLSFDNADDVSKKDYSSEMQE